MGRLVVLFVVLALTSVIAADASDEGELEPPPEPPIADLPEPLIADSLEPRINSNQLEVKAEDAATPTTDQAKDPHNNHEHKHRHHSTHDHEHKPDYRNHPHHKGHHHQLGHVDGLVQKYRQQLEGNRKYVEQLNAEGKIHPDHHAYYKQMYDQYEKLYDNYDNQLNQSRHYHENLHLYHAEL